MTSTTGDFTDSRQSVTKRRARIPINILNLTPLNLNEIRKEVEEGDKQSGIIEEQTNQLEICTEVKNNVPLEDISNKNELRKTEVLSLTPEIVKTSVKCTKGNDSFDLNFSALSLVTPVKKTETTYITPVVYKRDTSGKQSMKYNNFATPNVNGKRPVKFQYSASKTLCPDFTGRINKNSINTPLIEEKDETFLDSDKDLTKQSGWKIDSGKIDKLVPEVPLFDKLSINSVEYLVLNPLGRGGSSEVFACFNPVDKKYVAIKCVTLQNPVNAEGYINEVKLLQKLQKCDKIIKMYDYQILLKEKKLLVVLEKGGEDLSTILQNISVQKSHIPFYMLFFYWMEMLYAVKQIHSEGIIHADLKPANFLRSDTGLKLIDFGIASTVQVDMTCVLKTNQEGSCNYISPEALNQDCSPNPSSPSYGSGKYKLHFKSDVWSLGCILYQLVYRRTPFHHLRQLWQKLAYIVNPNHEIAFPEADWVPSKIIETMKNCLQYDVKSRPSVDELIEEYESFWCNNCFSSSHSMKELVNN